MGRIELLAPAGNVDSLRAAVCGGADAVYLGLGSFNARRNADNFTLETLGDACDYVHLRGARVYITLNTIVLPNEMKSVLECARQAYRAGADAFIIQDLGLAFEVARNLPDARIHISTQMNIHSKSGIDAVAELGAKRVTLARELSLPEIAELSEYAKSYDMEVEVFGHGAICICYSGQCFMSSLIGGRSANRGLCAQACRLPYALVNQNNPGVDAKTPGEFLLSPKDLCTYDRLDELVDTGISSLKIEGRMKSPEYVFSAVKTYRRALDLLSQGKPVLKDGKSELAQVFSRGFTDGYLDGERGNSIMGYQRPNNRGQSVGRVKAVSGDEVKISVEHTLDEGDLIEVWTRKGNARAEVKADAMVASKTAVIDFGAEAKRIHPNDRVFRIRSASAAFKYNTESPRVPIDGYVKIKVGEPLQMEFWPSTDVSDLRDTVDLAIIRRLQDQFPSELPKGFAEGVVVETARTKAITESEIYEHIDRLGSTPFKLINLCIDLDENAGLGFSQIHKCRAAVLEVLEDAILKGKRDRDLPKLNSTHPGFVSPSKQCRICAIATNPMCARAAKRSGATDIYVPALNYRRGQAQICGKLLSEVTQTSYPKKCIPIIPTVNHDSCGESRENAFGINVWDYVSADEPVLIDSIGALRQASDLGAISQVGPHLPVTNRESFDVVHAFGANLVWLSPELNISQIRDLANDCPAELGITVNGSQELMVSEHCVLMSLGECGETCNSCTRRKISYTLRDRKNYEFPVITDVLGRSHIYNSVALDLVTSIPELVTSGVSAFLVDTTFMDVEQTAHAVSRAKHALELALEGSGSMPKLPNSTSGHLFRGVS